MPQQTPTGNQEAQAQGSGFVIDSDGHIVTNDHVVEKADSVSVRFWNGNTYNASVVGTDPSTDLAVIKVDAPSSILHPVSIGDSSSVQVGDRVVAIGSPFGLEETVTSGIVSALHRQIQALNQFTINDSIQTDAAINHGNSGGPLFNSAGQVIGVNSQIAGDTGANVGIGFAIPSDTVQLDRRHVDLERQGRARLPRRLRPGDPRERLRTTSSSRQAWRSRRSRPEHRLRRPA